MESKAVSAKGKKGLSILPFALCSWHLALLIPVGIVKLDHSCIRLDLFADFGGVTDDDDRGAIRRHMALSYPLNLFRGDRVDVVAIDVQIVVRQIEHLNAYQLVD